jgi:serine/threonine-protein kinase
MQLIIELTSGTLAGRKAWISDGQSLEIGRAMPAYFVIPEDRRMSSIHFRVDCRGEGCGLRDLQSTNGTSLNGELIAESPLHNGDLIVAGDSSFQVVIDDGRESPAERPTTPVASPMGTLSSAKNP